MIRMPILLAFLAFALPAQAETARVSSGEHTDFSRLVITLEAASEWRFGRTADGYALSFQREGISFDTAAVFARIPKTRIGAVRQDPDASRLHVLAQCECHATAFEFRPGIIVVDVRNGPPEADSPFEKPVADREGGKRSVSGRQPILALAGEDRMRDELLRELSLGAARGVVEMALMPGQGAASPGPQAFGMMIGAETGFAPRQGGGGEAEASDPGCIEDAVLAIESWGGVGEPLSQLVEARQLLVGELDKPEARQVILAAQMFIHLGFGAEAQQVIRTLAKDDPGRELLLALGGLVDGRGDPAGTFSGMEACDTSAALWAILGRNQLRPSERIASASALRAFAALPVHLRQHLSIPLAQRFLEQGDAEAARRVKNTLIWSVDSKDPAVQFVQAALSDTDKAAAFAEIAGADRVREPEALIALVEARFEQRAAIEPELVTEIAAVRQSLRTDAARSIALTRALALAQALAGDFDAAFKEVEAYPQTLPDIWAVLAEAGPDTALLAHGVLGPAARRPDVTEEISVQLADRLAGLGLAEEASRWLKHALPGDPPETPLRLKLAELALRNNDLPTAIRTLSGLAGPDVSALRAKVAMSAGRYAEAATLYASLDQPREELHPLRLARQWESVSEKDEGIWQSAAQLLRPESREAGSPLSLAASRDILAESEAARATMAQLLRASDVVQQAQD